MNSFFVFSGKNTAVDPVNVTIIAEILEAYGVVMPVPQITSLAVNIVAATVTGIETTTDDDLNKTKYNL